MSREASAKGGVGTKRSRTADVLLVERVQFRHRFGRGVVLRLDDPQWLDAAEFRALFLTVFRNALRESQKGRFSK